MSEESTGQSDFDVFWEGLLDDVESTAEEYREEGWDVYDLSPGDVTAVYDADGRFGLSVLVPDDSFREVDDLSEAVTFESVEVYRRTVGPLVFLLVVERAPDAEAAVLVPLYYNSVTDGGLLEAAEDRGKMRVLLRALGADHEVTFVHDDPSLFSPEPDAGD